MVGVEAALQMDRQVQVQQRGRRNGPEFGVALGVRFFPGLIGGELGGAAAGVLVVPRQLGLEKRVGLGVVGDFFEGQEGD